MLLQSTCITINGASATSRHHARIERASKVQAARCLVARLQLHCLTLVEWRAVLRTSELDGPSTLRRKTCLQMISQGATRSQRLARRTSSPQILQSSAALPQQMFACCEETLALPPCFAVQAVLFMLSSP